MLNQYLANRSVENAKTGEQPPLIEDGKYTVAITKFEVNTAQSGWVYAKGELTVQGGKYDGRKVYIMFTLQGVVTANCDQATAEKATEEGLDKLLGFLIAAGHPNPNQPEGHRIEGLRLTVKVGSKTNKSSGMKENQVKGWEKLTQGGGATQGRSQAPAGMFGQAARAQAPLNITNSGEKGVATATSQAVQQSQTGADLNDEIPL